MKVVGTLATAAACLLAWALPIAGVFSVTGDGSVWREIAVFFSKAAVVTFGGAYAVLPYVAQQAVETHHWLSAKDMMHGLALAETTPGPLILVLQFVGFLAAARDGGLNPMLAGILGGILATWVTFAPSFLWIFVGAPYAEKIRNIKALSTALQGITAAVLGVMLNLGVWFGLHAVFTDIHRITWGPIAVWTPNIHSLDIFALALSTLAAILLIRQKWSVIPVLAVSAAVGVMIGAIRL